MSLAALSTRKKVWTDRELEQLPENGEKYELLDGELVMSPVSANHGSVCVRLSALLHNFTRRHKLGEIYDSSTGAIRIFFNRALLTKEISGLSTIFSERRKPADKFLYGAPDLAVEVLSPSDRMREMHRKLEEYFDGGTQVVWWVNWKLEQVHIYTPDSVEALTRSNEMLSGGRILPGFKCRLGQIFQRV